MFQSYDRRRFLHRTAGAVVAWHGFGPLVAAGEHKFDALIDPLLRPASSALPEAQNAYPLLDAAARLVGELPDGDYELEDCFSVTKPDPTRDRLFGAWLDENAGASELVEQALRRRQLEYPRAPWENGRFDGVTAQRQLSRLLQLRSQRLLSQGQAQQAAQCSATMADVAGLLKGGGGMFVEYLVACACQGQAWNLMCRMARDPASDATTVRVLLARMPEDAHAERGLRKAIQAEFYWFLLPMLVKADGLDTASVARQFFDWEGDVVLLAPREKLDALCEKIVRMLEGHPKAYDAADTVRRASDYYAGIMRDLELPWPKHQALPERIPMAELIAWPQRLKFSILEGGDPDAVNEDELRTARRQLQQITNPIGKKVIDDLSLDSKSLRGVALNNQVQCQGTRSFLAACLFVRGQGRLPKSLDELVDVKLLRTVPDDPYIGRPFQYSRRQQALWSVGPDGQVSPEKADSDETDAGQYVWRLDGLARDAR
jgi:hypothetical protein